MSRMYYSLYNSFPSDALFQHYDKIASLYTCSSEYIFKREIIGTLNIISI